MVFRTSDDTRREMSVTLEDHSGDAALFSRLRRRSVQRVRADDMQFHVALSRAMVIGWLMTTGGLHTAMAAIADTRPQSVLDRLPAPAPRAERRSQRHRRRRGCAWEFGQGSIVSARSHEWILI